MFDRDRLSQWVRGEDVTPPAGMERRPSPVPARSVPVRVVPVARTAPAPIKVSDDPLARALKRNGGRNPFLDGGRF